MSVLDECANFVLIEVTCVHGASLSFEAQVHMRRASIDSSKYQSMLVNIGSK